MMLRTASRSYAEYRCSIATTVGCHCTRSIAWRNFRNFADLKPWAVPFPTMMRERFLDETHMVCYDWTPAFGAMAMLNVNPTLGRNNAVHRRTACAVVQMENLSSVLGDGHRSGKRLRGRTLLGQQ
jgi:hypothetical protein